MRRAALIVVLAAGAALLLWSSRSPSGESVGAPAVDPWSQLDPQARCDSAAQLVSHGEEWPVRCRWRNTGEMLAGQALPPPRGDPPYDDPHVQIYVSPSQNREELARAIAHELGHMHHTREATFVADWLVERNLDANTPPEVWTEDYAEVFAALFAPPGAEWRAPTPRPSPEALANLRSRFFS